MNGLQTDWLQKILALRGMLGPIIYAVVLIVLGLLWPGYNHISQYMSELGALDAPHAIIMNILGFQLLGILIIAFGLGLYRGINKGWVMTISATLIIVAGSFMIAVGFFPCDPSCNNISPIGTGHVITSTIPAIVMPLAMLILAYPLRKDSRWQGYWLFSLVLGIVAVILSPLGMFTIFQPVAGLVQRLGIGVSLFWMLVMSTKLFRITS